MATADIAGQEHRAFQASPRPSRTSPAIRCALAAILLSVPCFWQPRIQADDLSSHLYNAWLANLAAAGRLPGLYTVPQFTNVLFDHLLSLLLKSGSVAFAEHTA